MTFGEKEIREMVRRVVMRTLGPEGVVVAPSPAGNPAAGPRRPTVTEADILAVPAGGRIKVPAGAMITPLARDTARERRIELVDAPGDTDSQPPVRTGPARYSSGPGTLPDRGLVAVSADHGGYTLKEELKAYLAELGYPVTDCGTHSTAPVDYPDYAYAVAGLVADGRAWRGIIVDGAGIGSCMAANKVPGVRAAMCYDQATAANSREHNDANVLTLGGGLLGVGLAKQIVKAWLETAFGGGRHARRVDKIMQIERRYSRG